MSIVLVESTSGKMWIGQIEDETTHPEVVSLYNPCILTIQVVPAVPATSVDFRSSPLQLVSAFFFTAYAVERIDLPRELIACVIDLPPSHILSQKYCEIIEMVKKETPRSHSVN